MLTRITVNAINTQSVPSKFLSQFLSAQIEARFCKEINGLERKILASIIYLLFKIPDDQGVLQLIKSEVSQIVLICSQG